MLFVFRWISSHRVLPAVKMAALPVANKQEMVRACSFKRSYKCIYLFYLTFILMGVFMNPCYFWMLLFFTLVTNPSSQMSFIITAILQFKLTNSISFTSIYVYAPD